MASHTIDILCGKCGAFMIQYQKKGTGQLIRLYLDKVIAPDSLSRIKSVSNKSELPLLACIDCGNRIGVAMPIERGRWAYRMIKGSFRRKLGK
jgi:hypothetical protein